mmetsp:Transcript_129653/g.223950  ORF Transcript_129653/g.223950 Transcript_129653/m.223950 type:complete len:192 (+) Transcript_129653:1-576(+)
MLQRRAQAQASIPLPLCAGLYSLETLAELSFSHTMGCGSSSISAADAAAKANAGVSPPEDYFDVLGVRYDANAETLRRAYQKEADKWHPCNADGKSKKVYYQNRFRLVSEAYQVLNDPVKRAQYSQYGPAGVLAPLLDPTTFYREFHGISDLAEHTVPRDEPPHLVYINGGAFDSITTKMSPCKLSTSTPF